MGVVATTRINVIVLLLGLIESAFASEGGGRDIYFFLFWFFVLDWEEDFC